MKLGLSATLLLACLTVAPVAFAQEPAPRASTDSPATIDPASVSTDPATATSPADGSAIEAPRPANSSPPDAPPPVIVIASPTPTPTPTPVPTPLYLATAYEIGPEDVLEISVWKNTELSRTVPVRPDGKVSLPLVNDIQASGLTPIDLRNQVTTKLSKY